MSQADDLLAKSAGASARLANVDTEPHIVISDNRFITVPEELKRLGVQHDHDIETVTFDCPRYWDGHDMSKMAVYINYMNAVGKIGAYMADDISVDDADDTIMHFTWTISGNVTENKGKISFLVCVKKTDVEGMVVNHWNSELCESAYISEGLEAMEDLEERNPDLFSQLLTYMADVENMHDENRTFFEETRAKMDETQEMIEEVTKIATPEAMQDYVNEYLEDNPLDIVEVYDELYPLATNEDIDDILDETYAKHDISSTLESLLDLAPDAAIDAIIAGSFTGTEDDGDDSGDDEDVVINDDEMNSIINGAF